MTLVLKKSVSALIIITVYDLHVALVPMETDNFQNKRNSNTSAVIL